MPVTLADEQQLLEKARLDPVHFGPLYDAYYPRIFGYVYRRTADYDLARDIAADTFLKAVIKLPRFQWRGVSVSAWLFRIATNEIRLYYRQRKYESAVFSQLPEAFMLEQRLHEVFEQERNALEEQMQRYQDFKVVQRALQQLPVHYQEVLSLRYFEQKAVLEIAEILGKNEGTVKSLLSRGLEKLKQATL